MLFQDIKWDILSLIICFFWDKKILFFSNENGTRGKKNSQRVKIRFVSWLPVMGNRKTSLEWFKISHPSCQNWVFFFLFQPISLLSLPFSFLYLFICFQLFRLWYHAIVLWQKKKHLFPGLLGPVGCVHWVQRVCLKHLHLD